jgi:hypothetical protein
MPLPKALANPALKPPNKTNLAIDGVRAALAIDLRAHAQMGMVSVP